MNCYQYAQLIGRVIRLAGPCGRARDPARADAEESAWLTAAETAEIVAHENAYDAMVSDLARAAARMAGMPATWDVELS